MTLIRWQPQRDLLWNVSREVGRLFDDMMTSPIRGMRHQEPWYPEVDVQEQDNDFVVSVDLPGMKREEVKITMEDNTLMIRGERKQERTEENENYHICERRYGTFQRAFTLPHGVEADKIRAAYKEGVLHITLPKAEEAKSREISIDVR